MTAQTSCLSAVPATTRSTTRWVTGKTNRLHAIAEPVGLAAVSERRLQLADIFLIPLRAAIKQAHHFGIWAIISAPPRGGQNLYGCSPWGTARGHVREKSEIKRVIKGPGHWR